MPEVAIYTRISQDPDGTQTATHRQEAACRAFAELRGWEVVDVYEDRDVSAYKPNVERPAFELLCYEIERGQFDGVLVWKLDRLVRRPAEFENFWTLCERTDTVLASATEPVDSSTALGIAIVRVLVTFAHLESATKGVRLRAKFKEIAESGASPMTGGRRAYGYEPLMAAIREDEAERIREAAERVIAGESPHMICRDWNRLGIPTLRNKAHWSPETLRQILTNPLLVGDRRYRGEVVAKGTWPPILDRQTFDRVVTVLQSRKSPGRTYRPGRLLTPFLVCAECRSRMCGGWRSRQGRSVEAYLCRAAPYGCGHNSIISAPLESYVRDELCSYLDSPELRRRLADRDAAELVDGPAAIRELRQRIDALDRKSLSQWSPRVSGVPQGPQRARRETGTIAPEVLCRHSDAGTRCARRPRRPGRGGVGGG